MAEDDLRVNNFDLIRLLAAFQVLNEHIIEAFRLEALYPVMYALKFIPGVPVFFIVSGFLVSTSWNRAPSARQYVVNRFLRLFPGLWVCVAISAVLAAAAGASTPGRLEAVAWIASQLTFLQFYNPDFLRQLPTGGLNGSLWTIPVEIQFYLLLPFLAVFARDRWMRWVALLLLALSIQVGSWPHLVAREALFEKILSVSILPYLVYFVVGVTVRLAADWKPQLFRGRLWLWAALYAAWIAIELTFQIEGSVGNLLNFPSIFLLAGLAVAAAFTRPRLAERVLRRQDISYGIYIYHMPIINVVLAAGASGGSAYLSVLIGTATLAMGSWRFVERPALRLKRYSSRGPITSVSAELVPAP